VSRAAGHREVEPPGNLCLCWLKNSKHGMVRPCVHIRITGGRDGQKDMAAK